MPEQRKVTGDDAIRSSSFHALWYESICRFTSPEKILIVDSASIVAPPLNMEDQRLEIVRLNINAGHSTDHSGKFSGWMRSVLLSAEYALLCDVDYFVYVEQDVLLYGQGIIEHCAEKMTKPFMFGAPGETPQPLQQSFFLIRRDALEQFINGIHLISERDFDIAPEVKFAIATSKRFGRVCGYLAARNFQLWHLNKLRSFLFDGIKNFDWLPIGYGRSKPIQFKGPYFYFQHGVAQEIDQYRRLLTAIDNNDP